MIVYRGLDLTASPELAQAFVASCQNSLQTGEPLLLAGYTLCTADESAEFFGDVKMAISAADCVPVGDGEVLLNCDSNVAVRDMRQGPSGWEVFCEQVPSQAPQEGPAEGAGPEPGMKGIKARRYVARPEDKTEIVRRRARGSTLPPRYVVESEDVDAQGRVTNRDVINPVNSAYLAGLEVEAVAEGRGEAVDKTGYHEPGEAVPWEYFDEANKPKHLRGAKARHYVTRPLTAEEQAAHGWPGPHYVVERTDVADDDPNRLVGRRTVRGPYSNRDWAKIQGTHDAEYDVVPSTHHDETGEKRIKSDRPKENDRVGTYGRGETPDEQNRVRPGEARRVTDYTTYVVDDDPESLGYTAYPHDPETGGAHRRILREDGSSYGKRLSRLRRKWLGKARPQIGDRVRSDDYADLGEGTVAPSTSVPDEGQYAGIYPAVFGPIVDVDWDAAEPGGHARLDQLRDLKNDVNYTEDMPSEESDDEPDEKRLGKSCSGPSCDDMLRELRQQTDTYEGIEVIEWDGTPETIDWAADDESNEKRLTKAKPRPGRAVFVRPTARQVDDIQTGSTPNTANEGGQTRHLTGAETADAYSHLGEYAGERDGLHVTRDPWGDMTYDPESWHIEETPGQDHEPDEAEFEPDDD
jgi:hypothetical protein